MSLIIGIYYKTLACVRRSEKCDDTGTLPDSFDHDGDRGSVFGCRERIRAGCPSWRGAPDFAGNAVSGAGL